MPWEHRAKAADGAQPMDMDEAAAEEEAAEEEEEAEQEEMITVSTAHYLSIQ
jgi:hypothetical protein